MPSAAGFGDFRLPDVEAQVADDEQPAADDDAEAADFFRPKRTSHIIIII